MWREVVVRKGILFAIFLAFSCLSAQPWKPWKVSSTFCKDADGYESFRTMKGKDSSGAWWQIAWEPEAVVVTAPDGTRKALDPTFPVEAHPHGAMSIHPADITHWRHWAWECLRLQIDTGRNGIGQYFHLFIVIDRKSKDWAVCQGRAEEEGLKGPVLGDQDLMLRWNDEDDQRPLRIRHEWKAVRTPGGIRVDAPPVTYQLEYGYPYWFRFWSDAMAQDPDVAEHQGWLSVAWPIVRTEQTGGTAHASRTAIPRALGKQVWRLGTGPDLWFPVKGTVRFRWEKEVEIRRYARPVERVTSADAARLGAGGGWEVILRRDDKGAYLGAMLIERRPGQ